MNVFLILSSLSVVFYVALLVAFYRDGRKRREMSVPPVGKLLAGTVSEFRVRTSPVGAIEALNRNSTEDVLWVQVTRHHWKPVLRNASSDREKPLYLAEPVSTKDDRQCG